MNVFTKELNRPCLLFLVLLCFIAQSCTALHGSFADGSPCRTVIHFLDVGQGDSTLISLPTGEIVLVDAGDPSSAAKISDYLRDLGIRRIDSLIFTHPHDDHIGGVSSVMRDFQVIGTFDSGLNNYESRLYGEYTRLVRNDPSRYTVLKAGDILPFGEVQIQVLHPRSPPSGNLNNDSLVLRVSCRDFSILLTGDVQEAGERAVLDSFPGLSGRILKVSHHGDRDASSDLFLDRIQPEVAIVSVGRGNPYKRPHQEVLNRLGRAGAKIYRTDLHGNIVLNTDGKVYTVRTAR